MTQFDPIAYINEPRWQESRFGLERIAELLDRMGRPQDRLKFVHVAGTNGKGSTCAFVASVLQKAGYRTGLFTSPYIIQFEERIRVDGQNIALDDLRDVTLFVRGHAEAMAAETGEHPTEFELMTAVAFEHFARCACDIVVCEVGMGGRLDSTNVIQAPEVCVITSIGLDHTAMLGDTPAAIAREKAGIFKPGASIVSWLQDDAAAMRVILDAAFEVGSDVTVPAFSTLRDRPVSNGIRSFAYRGIEYTTRLLGTYQPFNAIVAIEVVEALRKRGWSISDEELVQGIADTSWPGRFEIVSAGPPPIIVDGGHNPQGAAVLAESLRDVFPDKRVTFLMSVLADKDYPAMIAEVADLAKAFVCATPPNPRALPAADLAKAIADIVQDEPVRIEVAADFSSAKRRALQIAGKNGVVCAFGSLYSISELKSSAT